MTLSVEQLELVRRPFSTLEKDAERDEWTAVWNVVWVAVFDRVGEVTARRKIRWPISALRDDFVSEYCLDVDTRAKSGRLLANFALPPNEDPLEAVVSYVCSPDILRGRVGTFIKREVIGSSLAADPEAVPALDRSESVQLAISKLLSQLEEHISVGGIKQEQRTAGFQLFPRVLTAAAEKIDLSTLTTDVLRNVDSENSQQAESRVMAAHSSAQEAIANQLGEETAKLYNHGRGRSGKVAARLQDRIAKLYMTSWLWPLTAAVLQQLTTVKKETLHTYHMRYRNYVFSMLGESLGHASDTLAAGEPAPTGEITP